MEELKAGSALLEVHNLRYSYANGSEVLRGVDFEIVAGECVALIGPNGAGKSTLLLHLNGIIEPTAGDIRLFGKTMNRGTIPELRPQVGMVFQDPDDQLFMPTVADDVGFGPANQGLAPGEIEKRITEALERVGLVHLRNRPPYELSAGEKRGVAIATVLAMKPSLLAMDEPSANLDPRGRRRLIGLLGTLPAARLIITHDLEMVVELCQRVMILDEGRIAAQGPACEILSDEALMMAHGLEMPHSLRHHHPHGEQK